MAGERLQGGVARVGLALVLGHTAFSSLPCFSPPAFARIRLPLPPPYSCLATLLTT